jgi:hypothetical protein
MLPRWHASTFLSIMAMEVPMITFNQKKNVFKDLNTTVKVGCNPLSLNHYGTFKNEISSLHFIQFTLVKIISL